MRRLTALLPFVLLLGAGSAWAAPAPLNQARPLPPAAAARPAPAPPISFAPRAPAPTGALLGLPSPVQAPDLRPQCRAQCAKVRYGCAPDDAGCDSRWTQCLSGCR